MVAFTPASDVWTLGFDQFGNICWQNNETEELYYIPPGQPFALPPRNVVNAPCAILQSGASSIPTTVARVETQPLPEFGEGRVDNSPQEIPEAVRVCPASVVEGTTSCPSHPMFRSDEAKQWSRERDSRGREYYFNIVTGESQYKKPECLKKYPSRR